MAVGKWRGRLSFSHPPGDDEMNTHARPLRGVYLLTPDEPDTDRLLARLAPLLAERPALLQYRNKRADARLQRVQLQALAPLAAAHGVPLVANDDWRLAAELGLAGAHLGGDDGDLAQARGALGPDALLGASCYSSLDRAVAARAAGASYLAFGACFPSRTKPGAAVAALPLFAQARGLGVPLVAIGGITADNGARALAAGADLLAVIGGVFDAADPVAALRALHSLFDRVPTP
jgi:thiamine-phosphate pyrophosphorylase